MEEADGGGVAGSAGPGEIEDVVHHEADLLIERDRRPVGWVGGELAVGGEFSTAEKRLVEILARRGTPAELGLQGGLPVLEPGPGADLGVEAVAYVLQGQGLALGAALAIGAEQGAVAVGPQRLGLALAGHPVEDGVGIDLLLHLVAPQSDKSGLREHLDRRHGPAELDRLGVDGIEDAARRGRGDDRVAEALHLELRTAEAGEVAPDLEYLGIGGHGSPPFENWF